MHVDLPGLRSRPVCDKELRGHRYALLASMIDNPEYQPRFAKFLSDIHSRAWSTVLQCNEFQGDSDAIELYAIRCPTSLLGLVLVRSPFELYDNDHVVAVESLTEAESSVLAPLTTQKNWKPLP